MTQEVAPAAPAAHEHAWEITETSRCEDGHEMVISACRCRAARLRWPQTSEEIVSDDARGLFTARITHHVGALFMEARRLYLLSVVVRAAVMPTKDPVVN